MKRTISLILTAIFALCMLLSACEKGSGGSALSEVAASNGKKAETRRAFTASEQYKAAYEYVKALIFELTGIEDCQISIEPGSFYNEDFSVFDNIAGDGEQRTTFFEKAQISVTVPYWEVGIEGNDLAQKIADKGITCNLEADEYNNAYYEINGRDKTLVYTMRPGV